MASWSFLTSHARVLLCIAHDPAVRLRDIAASVGITERSAYGIVTDLTAAGYVVKQKDGRRNRYQIQAHLPLPEPASQEPAIGEVLALLAGTGARLQLTGTGPSLRPPQLSGVHAPRQTAGAGQPGPPHPTRGPRWTPAAAGKLLARKRPRLVPVTDKIIVARVGPAGQTWRAPRHCLQDESLRRAIEALWARHARTASVLRLLDVAL